MKVPVYKGVRLHGWAEVDEGDYEVVIDRLWRALKGGYAVSNLPGGGFTYMHRDLLGLTPGDGLEGDHINGNRLDNRRTNLRVVTTAQNAQNRVGGHGKTSRFRGVSFVTRRQKWAAQCQVAGVDHWLGVFEREEDAAQAAADFRARHMPFSRDFVESEQRRAA